MNHALFRLNPENIGNFSKEKGFNPKQLESEGFKDSFANLEDADFVKTLTLAAHFVSVCRKAFTCRGDPGVTESSMMTSFVRMARVS